MANVVVWIVWFVAVFACLGSAIAVISFTNPFYSAIALIGNLASLATLYLLLSAEFVAAAQVLVYAGAVMVMFLFVIAYLGDRANSPWERVPSLQTLFAVAAAGAILVEVITVISLAAGDHLKTQAKIASDFGSPNSIGRIFLEEHLLAFEITSIVLLAAAVGGVILGSERTREEAEA
jgi:NADH:ubiquinone oxidoreductase subunit 6 (subunit J)